MLQIISQVFLALSVHYGFGKHIYLLSGDALSQILRTNWESQTPGILASVGARISIAVLLCRLFGSKLWLRWYLYAATALQTTAECLLIIVIWAQCKPVSALWTLNKTRNCWDPAIEKDIAFLGQGQFNKKCWKPKVVSRGAKQPYLPSAIFCIIPSLDFLATQNVNKI